MENMWQHSRGNTNLKRGVLLGEPRYRFSAWLNSPAKAEALVEHTNLRSTTATSLVPR